MFVVIVALLVVIPVAEFAVILGMGQWIGIWPTIGLLFAVSLLGFVLVKHQGLGAWRRIRAEIRAGQVPGAAALDGALVLVAGTALLVPGFITDALGLLLLVPACRNLIRRRASRRFTRRARYLDVTSREVTPTRHLNL